MESILKVNFEGGRKFTSEFLENSRLIPSDQSKRNGGDDSAPEPFDYFLAALASCAAVYIQRFGEKKGLDWQHISLQLLGNWNSKIRAYDTLVFDLSVPESFSEADKRLVEASILKSSVMRHMAKPPQFEIQFHS